MSITHTTIKTGAYPKFVKTPTAVKVINMNTSDMIGQRRVHNFNCFLLKSSTPAHGGTHLPMAEQRMNLSDELKPTL